MPVRAGPAWPLDRGSRFRWRHGRANERRPGGSYLPNPSSAFQELPRDNQPLYLAGAFADGAKLYVAIKLLDRIILDEAVPAMNLYCFVGDANRRLGSEQLRHGGLSRDAHT